MQRIAQSHNSIFGIAWNSVLALMLVLLVLIVVVLFIVLTAQPAQAQTFKVLHAFTGGADGDQPYSGLTIDRAGNFYGTTIFGGNGGGNVYKLSHRGSDWDLTTLYGDFQGGDDGIFAWGGVTVDREGSLFGTTYQGGGNGCYGGGCGTVFKLRPAATACGSLVCPWTETVLYRFSGGSDGAFPTGYTVFDPAGNLYGTTTSGGQNSGLVYELTHSGGNWTFTVLYTFTGSDGSVPYGGVILDGAGDLYGTTKGGGVGGGTVFRLTYSGSSWAESVLHSFQSSDGIQPFGNLNFDGWGNLYGTTASGGPGGGGTVFMLSPSAGSWTISVLYSFVGSFLGGSHAGLTMDSTGNLYGTTFADGAYGYGSVFKLTPSYGGWTYTALHDFTGGNDGGTLYGGVTLDGNGNLYGTTALGGAYGYGVVWEITP